MMLANAGMDSTAALANGKGGVRHRQGSRHHPEGRLQRLWATLSVATEKEGK